MLREVFIPILLGTGFAAGYMNMISSQAEIKTTLNFVREDVTRFTQVEMVVVSNSENIAVMGARQENLAKRIDNLENERRTP